MSQKLYYSQHTEWKSYQQNCNILSYIFLSVVTAIASDYTTELVTQISSVWRTLVLCYKIRKLGKTDIFMIAIEEQIIDFLNMRKIYINQNYGTLYLFSAVVFDHHSRRFGLFPVPGIRFQY